MDLRSIDLNATITITLEDTSAMFTVHKDLICARSPFIKGCLQTRFKEAQEQKVTIREWQNPESVKTLIAWVYKGSAALKSSEINSDNDVTEAASNLVHLYVLADRFLMSDLKNEIIDQCHLVWTRETRTRFLLEPLQSALNMLTDHGMQACNLRSYIADAIADHLGLEAADIAARFFYKDHVDQRPEHLEIIKELLARHANIGTEILKTMVANMISGTLNSDKLFRLPLCDYHKHTSNVRCSANLGPQQKKVPAKRER